MPLQKNEDEIELSQKNENDSSRALQTPRPVVPAAAEHAPEMEAAWLALERALHTPRQDLPAAQQASPQRDALLPRASVSAPPPPVKQLEVFTDEETSTASYATPRSAAPAAAQQASPPRDARTSVSAPPPLVKQQPAPQQVPLQFAKPVEAFTDDETSTASYAAAQTRVSKQDS